MEAVKVETVYDPYLTDDERKLAQRQQEDDTGTMLLLTVPPGATLIASSSGDPYVYGAGAVMITLTVGAAVAAKRRNRKARGLRERLVRPDQITRPKTLELMERAQTAAKALESSRALAREADLKARAQAALPVHLWEIATGLRDYDLMCDRWVEGTEGGPVTQAMKAQKDVLDTVRESIRRRVVSLEEYAAHAEATDRRIAELERDEKAVAQMDGYLDLAARVARDDRAVAELEELTEQVKEARRKVEELMLPLREEASSLFAV